jgi:hypothetical protein
MSSWISEIKISDVYCSGRAQSRKLNKEIIRRKILSLEERDSTLPELIKKKSSLFLDCPKKLDTIWGYFMEKSQV